MYPHGLENTEYIHQASKFQNNKQYNLQQQDSVLSSKSSPLNILLNPLHRQTQKNQHQKSLLAFLDIDHSRSPEYAAKSQSKSLTRKRNTFNSLINSSNQQFYKQNVLRNTNTFLESSPKASSILYATASTSMTNSNYRTTNSFKNHNSSAKFIRIPSPSHSPLKSKYFEKSHTSTEQINQFLASDNISKNNGKHSKKGTEIIHNKTAYPTSALIQELQHRRFNTFNNKQNEPYYPKLSRKNKTLVDEVEMIGNNSDLQRSILQKTLNKTDSTFEESEMQFTAKDHKMNKTTTFNFHQSERNHFNVSSNQVKIMKNKRNFLTRKGHNQVIEQHRENRTQQQKYDHSEQQEKSQSLILGTSLLQNNIEQKDFQCESSPKNVQNHTLSSKGDQQEENQFSQQYMKKFIKLNPEMIDQVDKLQKVQILKHKQFAVNKCIQQRNFLEAINHLKELLTVCAREKHIENFGETIALIGNLYEFSHDLDNAVYSFIQLKNLAEITGQAKLKIKALTLLGQLMQDESDYDFAMILFRLAIHYSWYSNDISAEADLYDKIGFIYFMQGDIEKAKYFHERSIQHQSEDPTSEYRQQNVLSIQKQFENEEKCIPFLNQMVLAKLGLVTDQQGKGFGKLLFGYIDKETTFVADFDCVTSFLFVNSIISGELRFSTKISAELQIQMMKEDKEMHIAIHDPEMNCNLRQVNSKTDLPKEVENSKEHRAIQKIMDQKNKFQPVVRKAKNIVLRNTQYKDPQSQRMVDYSVLKLSVEEKVKRFQMDVYDDNRLQNKLRQAQVSSLISRQSKNQTLFYNHCSPNRNLLGFKYTFKSNSLKTQSYFRKIEQMVLAGAPE